MNTKNELQYLGNRVLFVVDYIYKNFEPSEGLQEIRSITLNAIRNNSLQDVKAINHDVNSMSKALSKADYKLLQEAIDSWHSDNYKFDYYKADMSKTIDNIISSGISTLEEHRVVMDLLSDLAHGDEYFEHFDVLQEALVHYEKGKTYLDFQDSE